MSRKTTQQLILLIAKAFLRKYKNLLERKGKEQPEEAHAAAMMMVTEHRFTQKLNAADLAREPARTAAQREG